MSPTGLAPDQRATSSKSDDPDNRMFFEFSFGIEGRPNIATGHPVVERQGYGLLLEIRERALHSAATWTEAEFKEYPME